MREQFSQIFGVVIIVFMDVPGAAIGCVGCWRITTVGSGSVGAGVAAGRLGSVAVGSGVGDSATVAMALPGVANNSAITKGSSSVLAACDRQPASPPASRPTANIQVSERKNVRCIAEQV